MRLQLVKNTNKKLESKNNAQKGRADITIEKSIIKHNPLNTKPGSQLLVSQTRGDQMCYTVDQIMHGTDEE